MIAEDYVSFETAKLLKEKGFDEYCKSIYHVGSVCSVASLGYHDNEGYGAVIDEKQNSDFGKYDNAISAPTLQMAMKWLREAHNLVIEPYRTAYGYLYTISSIPYGSIKYDNSEAYNGDDEKSGQWTTWEKACEDGIDYCLKHLI